MELIYNAYWYLFVDRHTYIELYTESADRRKIMALSIFALTIIAVLLATSAYSSSSGEVENTLLIAPSCDGSDGNCTTLTGYAQNSATVETNLIFLPGNHILETALLFDSSSSVALQGDCFANTDCPLINCSNVFIRFSNITAVTISNLNFVDCRVTAIPSSSSFTPTNNDHHLLRIANCSFTHSSERTLFISGLSDATIESCSFRNVSTFSEVVRVQVSTINICGSTSFTGNAVQQASSLTLTQTNATFSGNTLFSDNIGGFGGSVSAFNSYVTFSGEVTFLRSQSNSLTGAFASYNCTVAFYGETRFEQNSAPHIGAVIGGVSSRLKVFGNLTFYNNSAQQLAGALGLTYGSQIHFAQGANVVFELNRAGFEGGAIYIEDPSLCLSRPGPCFFQVDNIQDPQANLVFIDNHANVAGDDLYGGEINTCMIDNTFSLSQQVFDSITTFRHSAETLSSVASDPIQVCECINGRPNCEQSSELRVCTVNTPEDCSVSRRIYPGEDISVTLAAVGQGGGIVPAGIRPATNNDNLDLNIGRGIPISNDVVIRGINATCTTLTYTMTSLDPVVILSLYPRASLCINTDIPLPIAVNFIQPCPYGFETDPSTGQCRCQTRLLKLHVSCNISTRSFHHRGEHWIGFDNATKEIIIYETRCPFDYCLSDQDVVFTLEDTDAECAFNRSGLLCGQCKNGLSVQLGGTSQCKPCSSAYVSLLIPFAIAGIALVVLLFACELNVAVGTLSGLIFYANFVQLNRSVLFQSNTNILSIFIAWLNLDLGISTCFYNGMDVYASTWLQFVFPVYIWAVVGLIIFVSGYSKRVTKLLGSHPIAVLATLFLLSYVKILRVCLAVVLFEKLEYTDSTALVWEPDANIGYFQGKHIPLFLFTFLVFVLLVLPYTAILLFGQWIQTNIKWRRLAWFTTSQRLKAFLDVHHAPYKDKHRYWPGLLLVFRIILPIPRASESQSLFALSATVVVIVLLIQLWGVTVRGVYKKWPLDTLEGFFLVNLGVLMFITYHIQQYGGNQEAATAVSVSLVLVAFIGILLYHILILRLKLSVSSARLWLVRSKRRVLKGRRGTQTVEGDIALDHPAIQQGKAVTVSYISFREVLLDENPT